MESGEPQSTEATQSESVSPEPKVDPEKFDGPKTSLDQRSNAIAFGGAVTTPAREITSHRRKRGQDGEPNASPHQRSDSAQGGRDK